MPRKFILEGHEPVETDDWKLFAMRFETDNRHVAVSVIGPYRVSTVFLGLDHSFSHGPPLLFETMVFAQDSARVPGELDIQERCSTWEEAEAQHREVTLRVRDMLVEIAKNVDKILKPEL